mmetsp:Transcript_6992/g.20338  ORF Transcript_6992/g.20338 Transcript_6992/m.20338 type:complete len:95 (+) Transcript_6992:5831-6115(+)
MFWLALRVPLSELSKLSSSLSAVPSEHVPMRPSTACMLLWPSGSNVAQHRWAVREAPLSQRPWQQQDWPAQMPDELCQQAVRTSKMHAARSVPW